MGTETILNVFAVVVTLYKVKLNNPLMGTETYRILKEHIEYISVLVKLNNPLMGTETLKEVNFITCFIDDS